MMSSQGTREGYCNGILRRMGSLPRSIAGGVSRAMGHRICHIGTGGGRDDHNLQSNFQLQHPAVVLEPQNAPEEWTFLTTFEQQYGLTHPFFYACKFMEALKIAKDEQKFMFMYLHSPQHPFTPSFCRETLSSELVVQFLDANFVSWGGVADRGEGLQMAATLQPSTFPCCAVVALVAGDSMTVLKQIEGPISPAELVEILQRTVEEQGMAFSNRRANEEEMRQARARVEDKRRERAKEEEKIRADRELRQEQDTAYLAALRIDQEKEKFKNSNSGKKIQRPIDTTSRSNYGTEKQNGKPKETSINVRQTFGQSRDAQVIQILIRFPNGERREQSFSCSDKIQAIYRYIDSLAIPGIGNYRLISSFPRRIYGDYQMGMSLNDAGLHPKATLFLELL